MARSYSLVVMTLDFDHPQSLPKTPVRTRVGPHLLSFGVSRHHFLPKFTPSLHSVPHHVLEISMTRRQLGHIIKGPTPAFSSHQVEPSWRTRTNQHLSHQRHAYSSLVPRHQTIPLLRIFLIGSVSLLPPEKQYHEIPRGRW
ncbi:hypothetical protein V3481_015515 [Fusarium oxysporum f. sp. vasinfectum]